MHRCNGTTHTWSDDSYSYGKYPCPGPERCPDARSKLLAKEKRAVMAAKTPKKKKLDKLKEAAALRAKAEKLEAQGRDDAIRERCSYQGVEWDRKGQAKAVYSEFVPCPGYGGQPHWESYNDEYGSRQSCGQCNGSGEIFTQHYIRVPQYDAPKPPKEPV